MDLDEARRHLTRLLGELRPMVERNPEQEVRGMAVPVLDAVITGVKTNLEGSVVALAVREIISPIAISEGEPVRAADMLIVVSALLEALPEPPRAKPRGARVISPDTIKRRNI